MRHIENAQIDSQPVGEIEGQPNTGIFFVKALIGGENMALLEVRVRAGAASAMHAHSHESPPVELRQIFGIGAASGEAP